MHQPGHTTLSSHSLEHVPKSNTTLCRYILLVADQILHSGHCSQFTGISLIVTIAHTQQKKTGLRKAFFQVVNGCEKSFLIRVVVSSAFGCNVQSIFQNNQIIRPLGIKLLQHFGWYAAKGKS